MNEGILLNGVITLTGGAGYLALLPRLLQRRGERADAAQAVFVFAVGANLLLAGLRQIVAAGAQSSPDRLLVRALGLGLTQIDITLYYLAAVVAALTVISISFLAAELAGKPQRAVQVGFALTILAAFGLTLMLLSPLDGPVVSYWGSDWRMADTGVSRLLATLLGLPAAGAVAVMLRTRKLPMLAFAALVYYGALVPNALGLSDVAFMVARIAAASSALLAWEALRVPHAVPIATLAET